MTHTLAPRTGRRGQSLLFLPVWAALVHGGCSPAAPPLPGPADLAGGAKDMASPYVVATIHQIDTDSGTGPYGSGRQVLVSHAVAVTKVDKYVSLSQQECRYQVFVQDAACQEPPCGLVVKAIGPKLPTPTSTAKDCPAAKDSGTLLSDIKKGDNLRLRGRLLFETDTQAPNKVVEHQLFAESIDELELSQVVTPLLLSDPGLYGQFVPHLGTTWDLYEGMYVTLQPTGVLLRVTAVDDDGFVTFPGSTRWGNTFDSDYYPSGATTFPPVGTTFHAISGVVTARKGGAIEPLRNKDFVP